MSHAQAIRAAVAEAVLADQIGIDVVALGEHHRPEYAISSPETVLAGIAAATRAALQGGIRFAGAGRFVRELVETAPSEPRVVLDVSLVHSIDDVARRMLLEVARRLALDGHEVNLVDPEMMIPDPDPGDGGRLAVIDVVRSRAIAGDASAGVHRSRYPEQDRSIDRPIRRRPQPPTLVTWTTRPTGRRHDRLPGRTP